MDVPPGSCCPTCERRVPHPKKASSPTTKMYSYRVPIDDVERHEGLLDAAARACGAYGKPHHRFWTITAGIVRLLQDPASPYRD